MSTNPSPPQPMGSVSVGNVISAAVRIYRDHFKLYYGLAFTAYLWVLVPIYGWAKFSAISALISRLAYGEVIERPETVNEARSYVMPRMWSFLGAGLLVGLIYFGVALVPLLAMILGQNSGGLFVSVLLSLFTPIVLLIGIIWIFSRFFILEVPLAIENNVTATSAIGRSWKLTEGFVLRIIGVVSVAFLVTIPISIVVQIVINILQAVLSAVFPTDSPIFFLSFLVVLALSFASGALLIPFWQAIKAVIYYDLRTRKEGLGLEIRDSR